jgi:hypothetical protein
MNGRGEARETRGRGVTRRKSVGEARRGEAIRKMVTRTQKVEAMVEESLRRAAGAHTHTHTHTHTLTHTHTHIHTHTHTHPHTHTHTHSHSFLSLYSSPYLKVHVCQHVHMSHRTALVLRVLPPPQHLLLRKIRNLQTVKIVKTF